MQCFEISIEAAGPEEVVTEDMRVEHASITKNSLHGSIVSLKEHMKEHMTEHMKDTISLVEDVLVPMRIASQPGPVMTVSMLDETLEVRWISGNRVCESMSLSDAPWTNPLDVLQFKTFADSVLACVPSTSISGGAHPTGTAPIVLKAQHVYNDNSVQLEDTDDISCLTRLTVGTVFPHLIRQSLRDAVLIEQCLRGIQTHDDPLMQTQAFKKCQRDSRDLIAVMAYDCDREIFLANVQLVYEEFGGLDQHARASLLLAYHKKWPKKFHAPPRPGGPRPRRPARA